MGVGDYGAAYVLCMRALGLSLGTGDGMYGPDRELTRGQMASFLVRLWRDVLGRECPQEGASPFVDVAGSVHGDNIGCLFGLGITKGITAVSYGPGEKLKASQISRFLLRTYEKTGGRCEAGGDELGRALSCLLGLGVIPSKAEGVALGAVTRAQMAVYVIGLWHNIAGRGAAPPAPGKPVDRVAVGEDEPVTVPVRVDRVELGHVDAAEVVVSLGLDVPVPVGGVLSGAAVATGVAVAVDGEGLPQGLSLVVKGDSAVDVHIDYRTTAAALVLQTPGSATVEPVMTVALVSLLADLDEADRLAEQLESDAVRYGASYLAELSPEAEQALSNAVAALVGAVEDLAAGTPVADQSGIGSSGGTAGGGVVAGVGLVAEPRRAPAGGGGLVSVAGGCEPVWDGNDGRLGTWEPPPGPWLTDNDGVCLEGSISSLSGENVSWWSALLVPVTIGSSGRVRFFGNAEMYVSSKRGDIPALFGDVLWGYAKNRVCSEATISLQLLEWGSFGWFQNPVHCDWDSYLKIFRRHSGGTIENADLRPLYGADSGPIRRLAIVKSNCAGYNPYQGRLQVDNPERRGDLERTAPIYQAVHLLTPAVVMLVDKE